MESHVGRGAVGQARLVSPCRRATHVCLTCPTLARMANVTIRDPSIHGGEAVDSAPADVHVTATHAGRPIAELRPIAAGRLPVSDQGTFDRRPPG